MGFAVVIAGAMFLSAAIGAPALAIAATAPDAVATPVDADGSPGTVPAAPGAAKFALSATPPAAGMTMIDRGAMVMRGGAPGRREQFEVWRSATGERWMRSIVTAADGSYRTEAEWRTDAAEKLRTARGRGAVGDDPLSVQLEARPGAAFLLIERGTRAPERIEAQCMPDCHIDLSPSAVAMFAMTLDPEARQGEVRGFRWIGHSLNADSVLVDGSARFVRLGELPVKRPDGSVLVVRHDAFQESVGDLRTGFRARVYFNLWSDTAGRPLKFASSRTVGLREGYEDLAGLAPTPLETAFPEPAAP